MKVFKVILVAIVCLMFRSFGFTQFEPNQIPSILAWYSADSCLVNSGEIDILYDKSGNNYHASQSNIGEHPLKVDGVINGQPVVRFDGINDYLNLSNNALPTQNHTIFIVSKIGVSPGNKTLLARAYNASGFFIKATTTLDYTINNVNVLSSATVNDNQFKVLRFDYSSPLREININTIVYGSSSFPCCSGPINYNVNDAASIGSLKGTSGGTAWFLDGDIAEIIIYSSVLNTTEIQNVQNYLLEKYSPPFSLGLDINAYGFCPQILTPGPGFSSYLWSNGSTNDSLIVNQSGTYWVQAQDPFGLIVRDTINVTFPTFSTPPSTIFCQGLNTPWDAGLGSDYTYLWSTGSTAQSISISAAGNYHLQIMDTNGCILQSDTLTFTVDMYPSLVTLGNDTTLCSGNLLELQVGASQTVSYLWPDASTGATYAVDTTGNYFVETVNGNGCVARDTIHITISGTAPVASFTASNACLGGLNTYTDQSISELSDPINTWLWDLGDGTTAVTQNTSHTYATPGAYPIELYVESTGGCGAYFRDTIDVFVNPTAEFTKLGNCEDQTVSFTNISVDGDASITSYAWDFGMPWTGTYNTDSGLSPSRVFDTNGSYLVQLIVTDANTCTDTVSHTVQIDPTPVAEFTYLDGCEDAPIQFTNASTTLTGSTYAYRFEDNTTSIFPNPTKTFPTYGTETVRLIVTNTFGCKDTVFHDVQIHPVPVASIDLGPYCMGTYMEANNESTIPTGSIDSTLWIFNTTDTLYGPQVYYLIESLGQQEVELITFSDMGCSSSSDIFIDVTETLDVSFTVGAGIAAAGSPFEFVNTSVGTNVALWNFGDGSFSADFSPEHTYASTYIDSVMEVYVIGLNAAGCTDTAYNYVTVQRANLDLSLTTIYVQKQGNWYVVGVRMLNSGTADIHKVQLGLETAKGTLVNETWTGVLKPLQDSIYVFTSQPSSFVSEQDERDAFVCVNGLGFDAAGVAETYLANNTVCQNVEGEQVILLPIYPNPVTDLLTLEVVVTVDSEVTLSLFDSRGREVRTIIPQQTLTPGFYTFTVNVTELAQGTYFVHLKHGEKELVEKVVR